MLVTVAQVREVAGPTRGFPGDVVRFDVPPVDDDDESDDEGSDCPVVSRFSAEQNPGKNSLTRTALDSCRILSRQATIHGWRRCSSPGRFSLPPWLAGLAASRMQSSNTSARRIVS